MRTRNVLDQLYVKDRISILESVYEAIAICAKGALEYSQLH